MGSRAVLIAGTITALAGAVLMVGTASSPAPISPPVMVAEAPDSGTAVVAARSQRSPVAVASLRTPTREVLANPGGTFTAELSAMPVRVQQGGAWVGIDQTMVRRADGSIGAKATIGELTVSGGGAKASLVSLTKDGRTLGLHWPTALPEPTLSGNAATYPEVLPGVDLVILADRNGYQQHLVVKNAQAAKNPALASIRLGISAEGLRVSVDDKGGLHAVDDAGAEVFGAAPSTMWDSAGHTAPVGVSIEDTTDGALVLTPDATFLADPALAYPVTIDPRMKTFERWGWATVLSGKPNDKYWWTSGSHPWAQVGQCYTAGGECNGIGEAWAYFQFDTTFLNGKTVLGASFDSTVVHSPRCSDEWNQLYRTDGGIWDGMTWNSRPGGALISNFMAPDNCTGWWPVGVDVRGWLTGLSHTGFFLKAFDPNNQFAWRKYDPGSTKLRVTYNQTPNPPTNLRTDPALHAPCKWCGGKSYFGNDNIRLITTLSDPDDDLVRPQWRVSANGVLAAAWDGPQQISGATHDANVGLSDKDGKEIGWWVHASDDTIGSAGVGGPRPFVVDRTGFTAEQSPDVSAVLYQADGRWHGGVGVPDTFTFRPNKPTPPGKPEPPKVTDVDHYLWGWQNPPPSDNKVDAESLNGPASVRLTPPGDGPRDLYVQSVDRAGHLSPVSTHHFYVRAGNGPLAQWSFDGNANDTAFLGDRHGTLNGGATFAPGAIGGSVRLDGVDDHVSAPNAIRNDAAFSVSAWVNLEVNSPNRTVVSQDGAAFPGFALSYRAASNGTDAKWAFGVPNSTVADRGVPMAVSPVGMPQLNTWTHLAGVYDPVARQIRLYVNGTLVNSVPHTARPEVASGPVRIGRTMWAGNAVDYWRGGIDEVQLHDRSLSDAEIAAAVSSSGVQLAHWKFDDGNGATARNAIEGGTDAVLENGATFTTDGAVNGGVRLDGDDDVVSTPGPMVRTDQSFSVAAQVRLDKVNGTYTVLSQDGERICGFCLQYQDSQWVFVFPRSDADIPLGYDWVGTPAVPDSDDWTHLVGTYDATAHKIRLYVNGVLVGEKTATVDWSARKAMRIGQALIQGRAQQRLPGTVDEVRVYNRAISEDEVRGIVSRDNVTAGTWKLDGNAKDVNEKLDGEPMGGPDWSAGQTTNPDPADLAVRLNGTGAHISAGNAIDTDKSFSVTAWARLDKPGTQATVVSQDGGTVSGFMLRAISDRWTFVAMTSDSNVAGDQAMGGAVQPGVWTHLVGVYSKDRQRIELYVNGVLAGSAPHASGFDANNGFQIGRGKWNGGKVDYFPGAIDDVSVYSRTLFAGEIQAMAGRDLSLGHNWTVDEGSGTSAGDAVGARRGTLSGGANFGPGRVGNAVRFDGIDDQVSVPAVDVNTAGSFTVSAWVYLDGNNCDSATTARCVASAVSLDGGGTQPTKFRLGHVFRRAGGYPNGQWVFEMLERDGTITEAALTVRVEQVAKWVHLVGVFDAPARAIWLYVDGVEKDDGTLQEAWQASGELKIGRGKAGGQSGGWRGSVDDVRMYSGTLTADRISALYRSYPAPSGSAELPVADEGHWKFDENTGTTVADSSGDGKTATMRGGAGWFPGRHGSTGWFDGTSGYAQTAGPAVNTNGSFSVAAWAYLADGTRNAAVFGQDGSQASSFLVQYDAAVKKWAVIGPRTLNGPVNLRSAEPALLGNWTHLTLAFDAGLGQLRLYVNGALSAVEVGVGVPAAEGPLSIGRCKANGANGCYFPRGIDEVRAYGKALSDGEVRRVHDDVPPASHGSWRFDDGTARDYSWRQNPTTLSGGASFIQGVHSKALLLDGTSGSATAASFGVPMHDSFTVSAWAKLTRTDRVATVLGQDGDRRSGFVLQYRPEVNRWLFGAAAHDADLDPMVYANSLQPPALHTWTHLTGVYDYPARQLRIYVNGQLVGSKDNVLLWTTHRSFTIGRGKVNGVPGEFFSGVIDGVATDMGAMPDADIKQRAGWPVPAGGQLGRFINDAGDHYSANASGGIWDQFGQVPAGYHYEGPLGAMLTSERPGTRRLYACLAGADEFTSTDPACEGGDNVKIADLGWAYVAQPTGSATVPLYRCRNGAERFDSASPTCEGRTLDLADPLGYLSGYSPLTRYLNLRASDHTVSTAGTPPDYQRESTVGLLAMTAEPGTQVLMSCVDGADGVDQFLSLDPLCENKTVLSPIGRVWTQAPPGQSSRAVFRCAVNASGPWGGELFASIDPNCEGHTPRGGLGFVLTVQPGPPAA